MAHKLTKSERKEFLRIAEDLCYDEETLEKIKNAKTDVEVNNILVDARHKM